MRREQAFENWFRKLGTTQTDMLFNNRQHQAYNPFSPESKRMIQDVGIVELFELLETDSDAVRSMPIILECRHRPLHIPASLKRNSGQSSFHLNIHWTFSQFQNTSSRRENLTATDVGNFQKTKDVTWPIILKKLEKRCIKKDYKGIHDRFLRDHVFVNG